MSKAAHEYHLIDLVGISHGGFVSLAGARQFARQEGLSAWDIFHGNVRIEYHGPDDWEWSEVKAKQDLWMCLLLHAPKHYPQVKPMEGSHAPPVKTRPRLRQGPHLAAGGGRRLGTGA